MPEYFSCSAEMDRLNFDCFNTGIMVMNIKNLRNTYDDFTNYIVNNLSKFRTFDQTAYQYFYGREKLTPLPEIYNYKPYWGRNENAVIVHFHGPKPYDFKTCKSLWQIEDCKILFNLAPKSYYTYYLPLFKKYSPETRYHRFLLLMIIIIRLMYLFEQYKKKCLSGLYR